MNSAGGDGSRSICTQEKYAQIHYHWWRIDPKRSLMEEVRDIVANIPMAQIDRDLLMAQVRTRMTDLVRGQLEPIKHIKGPMGSVKNLQVFELRCGIDLPGNKTVQIRIYHVEPKKFRIVGGSTVVGLHFHEKVVKTTSRATQRAQDREITKAAKRYHQGAESGWGGAGLLPR